MELLIRLRPAALLAFTLGVVVIVYAVANRDEMLYLVGAVIGFGGITAFLVTEAFGRIAKTRSIMARWAARIVLVPSLLVSGSALFLIVRWGFSHGGV
jgi:hypothetical protein